MKQGKKITRFHTTTFLGFFFLGMLWMGAESKPQVFNVYHSPTEVNKFLENAADANKKITKLHKIAVSPGERSLLLLEILPGTAETPNTPNTGQAKKTLPAVFVAANMEGTVPIATEAALYLTNLILDTPRVRKDITWYILPLGNPDAAAHYFQKPLFMDARNNHPYNDDMDDKTDEDGVEDLDGNGIITMMRVKNPEGTWLPLTIPGFTGLMKQADWSKGEKGIYNLYAEGIDNDHDGQYNEDGPGGVNIGITFPHLFPYFTTSGGPWALSEDESYNLVKFITDRPEIAMAICFGESNSCLVPPRSIRDSKVDYAHIEIPADIAGEYNLDSHRTYTMDELIDIVRKRMPPGTEITEAMVAGFLGLGQVVNPLPEDLKFYNEISGQYHEFLKANKLDAKRLEPAEAKDGSFELWSYFHLGVPTFALDFWTPPAGTEEKTAADQEKSKEIKDDADPKEKALLDFTTQQLGCGGGGFIPWKTYHHPTLGEIEIGGFAPYTANTPPVHMLENLLTKKVPWIFELVKKRPTIRIANTEVKPLGNGLYTVKVWFENTGYLPYPTAMGKRNKRILPVVVTLGEHKNIQIIAGKRRSLIPGIPGHGVKMTQWILQVTGEPLPQSFAIEFITPNAGWGQGEIRLTDTETGPANAPVEDGGAK